MLDVSCEGFGLLARSFEWCDTEREREREGLSECEVELVLLLLLSEVVKPNLLPHRRCCDSLLLCDSAGEIER